MSIVEWSQLVDLGGAIHGQGQGQGGARREGALGTIGGFRGDVGLLIDHVSLRMGKREGVVSEGRYGVSGGCPRQV